ncbi:hypothetical protein SPRG_04381 [Saprolegnia parasitica CBS 223.65]|uniref:SET domain-containing protein n=1 Tax=Saprolegnia parasitica (strain CBS 223.65) TaxID=695850 RepID=A0A067CIX0_SAPPC|nr:hypothetical protein SPRG_04381 [Saprolegnia parasitica CBS 223.65]KDO30478.1 hypothetical protein SPRG_04381 [Saprolegnia parasitica CBS 223.65]|eukprot:XP_012198700.1 hypothetical protein SPRG_04381 [Saprolegnia parasitica CBS 223.65]
MALSVAAPTFHDAAVTHDASAPVAATTAISAGDVIFYEVAVVSSSAGVEEDEHDIDCDDEECGGCKEVEDDDEDAEAEELDELEIDLVSPAVVEHFDALMAFCSSHEVLHMVDLSKNLFKLFKLATDDASLLNRLRILKVQPDAEYLDAAVSLRAEFPSVVPSFLTDDDVAHMIGVLHGHSHELEDIAGTGLFLDVARLEHRCIPNCNLSTDGTTIWVTAIKSIAAGEVLTLDTFDLFLSTAAERIGAMTMMGLTCACEWCTGALPDQSRAYKCHTPGCPGIVHPTNVVFACTTCSATMSEAEAAIADDLLMDQLDAVESIAGLQDLVAKSLVHKYHSAVYHALDHLTGAWLVSEDVPASDMVIAYKMMLESADYAVPYPHDNKVQLLDQLAQSYVGSGDAAAAKETYQQAYDLSCICSGRESEEAALLKTLVENTPTNRHELLAAYGLDDECDEE